MTEKFSDYLKYGPSFTVYTDNNPLTYVLTSAKLNAVGLRWVAELADYDFEIKYRPGRVNTDADYLSRNAMPIDEYIKRCMEICAPEMINSVISSVDVCSVTVGGLDVKVLSLDAENKLQKVDNMKLADDQKSDEVIGPVYELVLKGCRPGRKEWKEFSRSSKLLMQHFGKLKIENGVLLRKTLSNNQIVLPKKFHNLVYSELHENMAHLCPEKVIDLARQRFYWPYMAKEITDFIQKKCRCVISKKPNIPERAPLVPIEATYPFEIVAIDFLHLDKSKGGYEYVLIVSDHFTRFTQAYATRTKSSKAAADKLFNEFILQFGFPKRIHHDRGPEFNSRLFKELHRLSGIKSSNTTPYHPMGNGLVERMNRTFINMMKSLPELEKRNWRAHLPKMSFAYNSTINKSTGFSPFFLMFGRKATLPIDYVFQSAVVTPGGKQKSYQKFVDEWSAAMKEAFKIANEQSRKASKYNKHHYDKKVKEAEILPGDHVLIKNVRDKGGTGKLKAFWETSLFVVIKKDEKLPVYTMENLNKRGDKRIVHRNLLMKANDLPVELFLEKIEKNPGKFEKKKKKSRSQNKEDSDVEDSDVEDSDIEVIISLNETNPVKGGGSRVKDENIHVEDGIHIEENESEDSSEINDSEEVHIVPNKITFEENESEGSSEINESEEVHSLANEMIFEEDCEDDVNVIERESSEDSERESANMIERESSEDSERESPEICRRSTRNRSKKKIFTYASVGGNPIIE